MASLDDWAVGGVDRHVVERDAVKPRQFCGVRMIADDQRNRATQLAGLMPIEAGRRGSVVASTRRSPSVLARCGSSSRQRISSSIGKRIETPRKVARSKSSSPHSTRMRNKPAS